MARHYLQKALVVNYLTFILVLIPIIFSEEILIFLRFRHDIALNASNYIKIVGPSLVFFIISDCLLNYLQSEPSQMEIFYIQLASLIGHIFFNYVFMIYFNWMIIGAATARLCT